MTETFSRRNISQEVNRSGVFLIKVLTNNIKDNNLASKDSCKGQNVNESFIKVHKGNKKV